MLLLHRQSLQALTGSKSGFENTTSYAQTTTILCGRRPIPIFTLQSSSRPLTRTCRGEHIHHGYFLKPEDSKEIAQVQLIALLLERSRLPQNSTVLDVGCGVGGTTRYLAREHSCSVTGITISGSQVQLARKLTVGEEEAGDASVDGMYFSRLGGGRTRFMELDAEKMGEFFRKAPNISSFDAVWISEALSHLPNKPLFFQNAFSLLNDGGSLVIADWFKSEDVTPDEFHSDIEPIEGTLQSNVPAPKPHAKFQKTGCSCRRCVRSQSMSTSQNKLVLLCWQNHLTSASVLRKLGKPT